MQPSSTHGHGSRSRLSLSFALSLGLQLVIGHLFGSSAIHAQTFTFSTLAGSTNAGSSDGPRNFAGFNQPQAVTVDLTGNVYVADTGNRTIRWISPTGLVTTVAGSAGLAGVPKVANQERH